MSKVLKSLIREEIEHKLGEVDGGVFITYAGLDSEAMYDLRKAFNSDGVRMRVIPNRITRKAMEGTELTGEDLGEVLRGDTAMITGENAIAAARSVRQRIKDGVAIQWKGALLQGEVFDAEKAAKVADLPTREELLAQIAFCFQANTQKIAGCFQQTYKQIAGVFKSYEDKQE